MEIYSSVRSTADSFAADEVAPAKAVSRSAGASGK
jgi:hypothetical protein